MSTAQCTAGKKLADHHQARQLSLEQALPWQAASILFGGRASHDALARQSTGRLGSPVHQAEDRFVFRH